ncbi:MAG: class I SAM-dependent methyltransferase [Gammaproteobacteria bacterium]|nr:class I SAM-dependent methyltransferase [Gammaproteobacteria bacterium]
MESYTYQLMREFEDKHWWFVARRNILKSLLSTLHLPERASILEVGAGTGGNIGFLQDFGDVICVESDEQAAQLARERKMAPVLSGELPNGMPALDQHFDLIVLFDVIEHIEEDGESLRVLARLLNPGGRIVLTVPAFAFLWSQHDDENHHKRRYNRRSIVRLVKTNKLSLGYISYFNFWLFPLVASIRIIRKVFPYKGSWQDMKKPKALPNKILRSIFSSERHFVGKRRLPFGISLVAVISVPDSVD